MVCLHYTNRTGKVNELSPDFPFIFAHLFRLFFHRIHRTIIGSTVFSDLTKDFHRSIIFLYGLVAQLGAHHIRIVGVGSSNLLKSTNKKYRHKAVLFIGMTRRFEESNAAQMSAARCGSTQRNLYFYEVKMQTNLLKSRPQRVRFLLVRPGDSKN